MKHKILAIIFFLANAISAFAGQVRNRQPVPEKGFWVAESERGSNKTRVYYYSDRGELLQSQTFGKKLNVKRLPVRKHLNQELENVIARDTVTRKLPTHYEVR